MAARGKVVESRALLFDWRTKTRWNWKLTYFVATSLMVHLLVFYLFQVSYPPVERANPKTNGITLLSSRNAQTAQLLRELRDHTFHQTQFVTTDMPLYSMDVDAVRFKPSFTGFEIPLRPLTELELDPVLPFLSRHDHIEFPPLPGEKGREGEGARGLISSGGGFDVEVTGGLRGREWTLGKVDTPKGLVLEGRLKVYAGVSPQGEVLFLSPMASDLDPEFTESRMEWLRKALRFEPADETVWGWIELIW